MKVFPLGLGKLVYCLLYLQLHFRWFMLQTEAQALLTSNAQTVKQKVPFDPGFYMTARKTEKHTEDIPHTSTTIPQTPNLANSGGGSPRHYR